MTIDAGRVPTLQEIYDSKDAMDDIGSFTYLGDDSFVDAQGTTRDTVNGRLKKMGYDIPVIYTSDIVFAIEDNLKTIDEDGIIYAPLPSALPFTTSGVFEDDDDSRFFVIQNYSVSIEQGIMDWNSSVLYAKGALAKSSTNPGLKKSVVEQSDNDIDTDDGTNWGWASGSENVIATEFGPTQSDLEDALAYSLERKTWLDCAGVEYEISTDFIMPSGSRMKNFRLKFTANVPFRGNSGCEIEDGFMDGNSVADYGIRDVVAISSGWLRGKITRIFLMGFLISDIRLNGFHWLLQIDRVWCFSQSASGYGVDIDNYLGILNPDISIKNLYVDGGAGGGHGMRLDDGQYLVESSSADNVVIPLSMNNSFAVMNSVGFEQFSRVGIISSSQLILNLCTLTAAAGSFTDDSGQRAMLHSSGGTINGSIRIIGGIYQNNSTDPVAKIRISSVTPPELCSISRDVENRLGAGAGALTDFIYQSIGSPTITAAKVSFLGEHRSVFNFGGIEPTPYTVPTEFVIENTPNVQEAQICSDGVIRYIYWRETGESVAGATTEVDMQIWRTNNSKRKTVSGVISIPGVGVGFPQREGSAIIDEPVGADEYVRFVVNIAGQRAKTGFAIGMPVDT